MPQEQAAREQKLQIESKDRITVRSNRITMGNAVDCPQVRADDGTVMPVS